MSRDRGDPAESGGRKRRRGNEKDDEMKTKTKETTARVEVGNFLFLKAC